LVSAENHGFDLTALLGPQVQVTGEPADDDDQYRKGKNELGAEPVRHDRNSPFQDPEILL
jgi:hypothetical protein